MQIQNAAITETLQAVRSSLLSNSFHDGILSSFELGGEKKTKGAALTFVSRRPLFSCCSPLTIPEVNLLVMFLCCLSPYYKYDMYLHDPL